jgi:hypothetical protein
MTIKMTEREIEEQQIEWVFGLTGGELEKTPWVDSKNIAKFAYWYESVPEWATEDFDRDTRHSASGEYRTGICTGGGYLSLPPDEIEDINGTWILVKTYAHSGESECPGQFGDFGHTVTRNECVLVRTFPKNNKHVGYSPKHLTAKKAECPLCGERVGSNHGYIYVGESYEAVYKFRPNTCKNCLTTPDFDSICECNDE